MAVLQVNCAGSPYEIGLQHGTQAHTQIHGSLKFYTNLFQTNTNLSWSQVRDRAAEYLPPLQDAYPRYIAEMRGIADGVNQQQSTTADQADAVDILDILALNVRSEILFGLFTEAGDGPRDINNNDNMQESKEHGTNYNDTPGEAVGGRNHDDIPMDGCTSLGFVHDADDGVRKETIIAQNWDWMLASQDNLIILHIATNDHKTTSGAAGDEQDGEGQYPDIVMVTEAGIIGKIGFNSAGVGICQNAIRARGIDVSENKLPVHLAMRRVLECWSQKEAVEELKRCGVSGSVYLLIGGGIARDDGLQDVVRVSGVECTSTGVEEMFMSVKPPANIQVEEKEVRSVEDGDLEMLAHANRLLLEHAGVEEPPWLVDSDARTTRLRDVVNKMHREGTMGVHDSDPFEYQIRELFKDEEGYPVSINRRQIEGKSTAETLFTIVMNLTERKALISFGRPTEWKDAMEVSFSGQDGKLQTRRNVRPEAN